MEQEKLRKDLESYAETGEGRIQVQISSLANGLERITDVNIVRVRGKDSNLLIMEDYLPIIGEVEGDIDFFGRGFFRTLENVRGFFSHTHNVFFLLLKENYEKNE
jgi:hypothetical protein